MRSQMLVNSVLLASTAMGVGAGVLVSQVSAPGDGRNEVQSVNGAGTGVEGAQTKQPVKRFDTFTTNRGAMQSIRGIKGIDTVMLQNLEAVLRMQAPPLPPTDGGGGGGRAAAALLTVETDEPPEPEAEPDGREELNEFELKGS